MNRAIKYLFSFRCVALLCALSFMQQASAQTLPFYGDSSRFSPLKNGAGNELIIESSTKNIHGALVNYANGRTHFKLVIDTVFSLNDTTLRFRFTDNSTKDIVTHGTGSVTVESDPVAIAKTITVTPGIGMLGSASTQALNVNPSFTTNIDTFAISTRAWRQKLADSLGAIIGTKISSAVTSVATNIATGITGGTITSTGTLAIDTFAISTRAWRQKLADSLGSIISTKIFVDTAFTVPAVYTDTVKYTKNGNTYTAALIDHTDDRLFGLTVTSGGGLTLNVTSGAFRLLDGNRYTSAGGSTTLATADASLPRKDVIYVDNTGAIGHITGTPATNPTTPQVDPVTQLLLTEVNVDAGATSINVTPTIIYDEPATDAFTGTNTGVTVNYTNTSNVQHLTQSADVGSWTNGQTITFTKNSGTLAASDFSNISGFIKLKSALASTANIRVSFLNGTTVVSNVITLAAAQGFSKTILTYQNIAIPISAFTFSSTTFNKIRITLAGTGGGFYLDFVQLQNGISQSTQETDPIANAKTVTITPGVGMLGSVSTQTIINNPSFTTNIDTFATSTRAWRQKLADSLGTIISGKQSTLTLTTTGSSGASTLVGSTLNIPQYAGGGTGTLAHTYAPLVVSGDTIYKRFNILAYGAKAATTVYTGAISSSSSTLTATGANFVSGDVGKIIVVKRAGTSGRDLITTIASFTNSTTVTLTASASATVSVAQVTFGSDCTTAIQLAINAADAAGGGEVFVPLGTFIVAGALQTSVGGVNMNSQLYIPYHTHSNKFEVDVTIKGEAKPVAAPVGGGLSADATNQINNTGSNLYSTLTSGATGAAVIGTGASSGFNASTLSVEDLMILVVNNPGGIGPVVGGISGKKMASVIAKNVVIAIDTTGYNSTYPSNDITGIETTDAGSQTFNTLENTLIVGLRSGYKIGEHVSMNQAQTMSCFYGFFIKFGAHNSTCTRSGTFWNAYDIYAGGSLPLSLFKLDAEWQQTGKWYDDVNTVKDSANLLSGDIFYSVVEAGVAVNNAKFSLSGGTNVYCLPDNVGVAGLNAANTFTQNQTITKNGNTSLTLNTTSSTGQASVVYNKSGTTKWQTGIDFATNGTADWFLYDQANTKARIYAGIAGTLNLGGTASAASTAAIAIDNSNNVAFDNNNFYWSAGNHNLGIGTAGAASKTDAGIQIDKATPYVYLNSTTSRQAAFLYCYAGTTKWQLGMDFSNTGTADFYIYNQANSKVREYINTTGDVFLGGAASTSSTAVAAFKNSGGIAYLGTATAAGTTGAQTINKPTGIVNFAAGAQTLVVTNSLATASSLIFCTILTDDATATSVKCVTRSAGSFTIKLNATATAETAVCWHIQEVQ